MSTAGQTERTSWLRGGAWYAALLMGGILLFLLVRQVGEGLVPRAMVIPGAAAAVKAAAGGPGQADMLLHVMGTLTAVIALGFVLGRIFRRFGQPQVIGEVVAGIVLGPSVLGAISPDAMHALIPSLLMDPNGQVPSALKAIAQLGVVLYMFLVGLELNGAHLKGRAHDAVAVSHASIIVPFVLGAGLSLWLYRTLCPPGVSFTSFALFMGVAMSVTAFPVLARILTDRGMEKSPIGVVALGCAAADDLTAWCLLALVVGVAQAHVRGALSVTVGAILFAAFMFVVARPCLVRWVRRWDRADGPLPGGVAPIMFVLVLLAALSTEAIGVHAVFGAFLLGAVVPHDSRVAREFVAKLKEPVTVLLLPAFFAFTGMRTQIGLVSTGTDWLVVAVICLVATLGKFGGTFVAARLAGHSGHDAAVLGTLMNTRGLMELIVLNIGLDLKVLSPTLFAMMVLMALSTTMATGPVLEWLGRGQSGGGHSTGSRGKSPVMIDSASASRS